MRMERYASWDLGYRHMGVLGDGVGNDWVRCRCMGCCPGTKGVQGILAGNVVIGLLGWGVSLEVCLDFPMCIDVPHDCPTSPLNACSLKSDLPNVFKFTDTLHQHGICGALLWLRWWWMSCCCFDYCCLEWLMHIRRLGSQTSVSAVVFSLSASEEQAAKAQDWKPPVCCDDDDDKESSNSLNDNISKLPSYSAITPDEPVLSTEELDNSLSMGDEHLDTIPATESDEFIKSGVENLIPIPSESEGIPEHASPPDSELVSSEVMEIIIPEVGRIKASNDNPIPSYDPIIPGNPPNLTPSGESYFFSEVDAFLAVEDEFTSS
uniref:Uncharacterized protein n=1 Tax=Tanacetum cinerariifolium TaxID=118510 RepID=A0A699KQH3_TANCI|nr:hypothetical protein [Tanacetum cinerariifolium]